MFNLVFKSFILFRVKISFKFMELSSKIKQNLRVYTKNQGQIGERLSSFILALILVIFTFSTSYVQAQGNKNFKVKTLVIDAGHGGHDPGCLGSSVQEKFVCLGVALKLGKLVEDYFKDVKVIYTRDSDVFVKLMDRAKIANKNKADLFISIHANSAQNKNAFGTETFVMGTKYTDKNLELTKRENSVILLEKDYEKNYEGYDPNSPMANILMGLYQQEYLESSINFASKIEHQFRVRNKRNSRGVRQRVLLVMYRTTMPSVLVETGFLTNKVDHKLLKDEVGQAETAGAIFRAFLEYKREMEGVTSSQVSKEEALVFSQWDSTLVRVLNLKLDKSAGKKISNQIKIDTDSVHKSIATKRTIELENAKENAKAVNHDLIFRVQITSSNNKIPLNSRKFKGLSDIFEYKVSATFKYAVGNCITQSEAVDIQGNAKALGFKDAFVIAFFNGNRVSMKKAREIISKGNN